MSLVRLYRARAHERSLAWTVALWRPLGLGPGAALFTTADGMVAAFFDSAPPLLAGAFDARMPGGRSELRWLASERRDGERIGAAVLVSETDFALPEGFERLDPHDAHPRDVGYELAARLHESGRETALALTLREYLDAADPDHPGKVDERLAGIRTLRDPVSPPW